MHRVPFGIEDKYSFVPLLSDGGRRQIRRQVQESPLEDLTIEDYFHQIAFD